MERRLWVAASRNTTASTLPARIALFLLFYFFFGPLIPRWWPVVLRTERTQFLVCFFSMASLLWLDAMYSNTNNEHLQSFEGVVAVDDIAWLFIALSELRKQNQIGDAWSSRVNLANILPGNHIVWHALRLHCLKNVRLTQMRYLFWSFASLAGRYLHFAVWRSPSTSSSSSNFLFVLL